MGPGLTRTTTVCLVLVAAAALAAGGLREAHAQQDGLVLTPIGQLSDGGNRELDGAAGVDVFEKDGKVYAVVAGFGDHGIQIVDLTDPGDPSPAGRLGDSSDDRVQLRNPRGVEVFEREGKTYAAVVGKDDAVQLVDISNPKNPEYAGSSLDTNVITLADSFRAAAFERDGFHFLVVPSPIDNGVTMLWDISSHGYSSVNIDDTDILFLRGASGVDVFEKDGTTYAVVASSVDDGIQLFDVTDLNMRPAGKLQDKGDRELNGAFDVAVFETGGGTYAAVTGHQDNGISIVDVSDPNRPTHVGRLADSGELRLRGPTGIDAFRIDAYSYVAVASDEDALQIVDVTDPANPVDAGKVTDGNSVLLSNTNDVKVFKRDGMTYAAVTSFGNDGIQIVRLDRLDNSPPIFVSATLDEETGNMTITFNETIDVSQTRTSHIVIYDANGPNAFSISGVIFDSSAPDSDTLSVKLKESHLNVLKNIETPTLRFLLDSVYDLAGLGIVRSDGNPITISDSEKPVITLRGQQHVAVELGGTYTEQGASVSDNDPAYETTEATVGGDAVDASAAGVYTVTYTAPADGAGNDPDPVSRTVTVRDTTKPVITLRGQQHVAVELGGTYTEQGASVSDNDPAYETTEATVGGDAVDASAAGVYTVTYTAPADGAGNDPDPVSRTVTVRDTTKPVITLRGPPGVAVELGGAYAEQGASVSDNDQAYSTTEATVGGDTVDAGTAGNYTVTYTAPADGAGNAPDPVSRTVTVGDFTPPSFVSATLDPATRVLEITFDEDVDVSETVTDDMFVNLFAPGLIENILSSLIASFDRSAPDSDTLAFTLDGTVDGAVSAYLDFYAGSVKDLAGNGIFGSASHSVTVLRPPPGPVDPPGQACAPPSSGHWDIRDSCALESDARAPAGITVHAPAVLYIPAGVTLDVDLANHGLLVRQGAGLLIQHGGGMR